jgi:hypothetical protein
MVGEFFDQAMYYLARGYEGEVARQPGAISTVPSSRAD